MFGGTDIVKNKNVYNSYGIAFDWKGNWTFGNDLAKNFLVLGVDNSSSYYTDNLKNDFNFRLRSKVLVKIKDFLIKKK